MLEGHANAAFKTSCFTRTSGRFLEKDGRFNQCTSTAARANHAQASQGVHDVQATLHAKQLVFIQSLESLVSIEDREQVSQALQRVAEMESDKENARETMLLQIRETFLAPMNQFVRQESLELKHTWQAWTDAVTAHEVLVGKHLARRKDAHGWTESESLVVESHKQLQRKAVMLAHKLNQLHTWKRNDPLHHLAALLLSQDGFHHTAWEMSKDTMRPILQTMSVFLNSSPRKQEKLQDVLNLIKNADNTRQARQPDTVPHKQGWLFQRNARSFRTTWTRHYLTLTDHSLSYHDAQMEIDLRVCMVRVAKDASLTSDRPFCFELISPTKSCTLQADSQHDLEEWMSHIQTAIGRSLHIERASRDPSPGKREIKNETLKQVLAIPGNDRCVDCGAHDPDWASFNLGLTMCLSCSGIHRGLGSGVSKIRSLTLDAWEPELLELMYRLGNRAVNACFEWSLNAQSIRPTPTSERGVKQDFITEKYASKLYVQPFGPDEQGTEVSMCLWKAIQRGDLPAALRFLALGADVNWICHEDDLKRTALHVAVSKKDVAAVEFLLMNQALLEVRDALGNTALHHAVEVDHPRILVSLLLKRRPRLTVLNAKNEAGQTALEMGKNLSKDNMGIVVSALQLYKLEAQPNVVSSSLAQMMEELLLHDSTLRSSMAESALDVQAAPLEH